MATFSVNGKLFPATTTSFTVRTSLSSSRKFLPPSSFRVPRTISTPSPRVPYLKCGTNLPNRGIQLFSKFLRLNSMAKPLALCVASAVSVHLLRGLGFPSFLNGGRGGGGGGGRSGGGRDGNDGGFWSGLWRKLFSSHGDDTEQSPVWDSHGLPENLTVQLNELDSMKKYKISEITFFDETTQTTSGTEDILILMLSIIPSRVYTKDELLKELEILSANTMFKKMDMKGKTKPDGTLGVTISLEENTWPSPERIQITNLAMNERPCLLPDHIHYEVNNMLMDEERVSARLLRRVIYCVENWYYKQGYVCAKITCFKNRNTKEFAFEITEGEITQVVVQFQDKLGNVVENARLGSLVRNKLPKQVRPGNVFSLNARREAVKKLRLLKKFSSIEVDPRPDENNNQGGVIVEIKLKV